MKKKLINHAIDIARDNKFCYQYTRDMRYWVTDGCRILEYDRMIETNPMLEVNTNDNWIMDKMDNIIRLLNDREMDYTIHNLPSTDEIRQGIRNLVGRKQTPIVWSDGTITVNARYLIKAMENLNATVCYVPTKRFHPIALFEDDDLTGMIREMIFPVTNPHNNTGFWIKEV